MKYHMSTEHPVAADSPDHIQPRSTRFDNTINERFNKVIISMFNEPSVLDFGCAGGGMVRSFIDAGCEAVGLEGSDYNREHGLHEWPVIPDNLFTCDLGFPFTLYYGRRKYPHKFDVVTMWEFIEHIPETRLPVVISNAKKHLKKDGLIIGSTNEFGSVFEGVEHHLTKQPIAWWYDFFAKQGLKRRKDLEEKLEHNNAWVRKVKSNFVLSPAIRGIG